MPPSSQMEILIFQILLQLKNNSWKWPFFFLGNLFLISQCFWCEKGQYVLFVSVLVIAGLIVYGSGTLSASKEFSVSFYLGMEVFPKIRAGTAGCEGETRHSNISHATQFTWSCKQLGIAGSAGSRDTFGSSQGTLSVPVPCLVWYWAFRDPIIIWQTW